MDDLSTLSYLSGQRTLAAIVFTDVVSFSAATHGDEEHTLALVRRDLKFMREICEKFDGKVMKTMGDGQLLYFHSAIQAVSCALEIQKKLAENAKTLPEKKVLAHRIGVHLGDVYLSEADIVGEGVNIASQLQHLADPGGICISQTVYDVVKGRLEIQAVHLGARKLTDTDDGLSVYKIRLPRFGRSFLQKRAGWLVAGLVGVLAVFLVVEFGMPQKKGNSEKKDIGSKVPSLDQIQNTRLAYLDKNDFAGFATWMNQNHVTSTTVPGHDYPAKYAKLSQLRSWIEDQMSHIDKANPLRFRDENSPEKSYEAFLPNDPNRNDPNRRVRIIVNAPRGPVSLGVKAFEEIDPQRLGMIALALLDRSVETIKNPALEERVLEAIKILMEENQVKSPFKETIVKRLNDLKAGHGASSK